MLKRRVFTYQVPGLMCSDCSQTVKAFLKDLSNKPNYAVYVDWVNEEISVQVLDDDSSSDKEIQDKIKKALNDYAIQPAKPLWHYILKGIVGTASGLVLLILMACGGFAIPMLAMYLIGGFSALLTLVLGFDTYQSAFRHLFKERKLTMDALFTVSTLTALGVSIASFFIPWLPMMFDAPLLIFGFKHIGTAIEQTAKRKILKGIDFRDRAPHTVAKLVRENDRVNRVEVEVNTLKPGDTIIVPAGGIIPVDGVCADDYSYVYLTIYKGQTEATKIVKGHKLRSGMQVSNDNNDDIKEMTVIVTAEASDSFLTRLDKRMDDIKRKNIPMETKVNKFLRYFVPGILLFTMVSAVIVGCLFPPALAIQCVISTLVAACPCTLGIIIPLAVKIGMSKGKGDESGVEFKSKEAIQAASEVDTVVFDLNGTLTKGVKEVSHVIPKDEQVSLEQLSEYMYLLEEPYKNGHAVAKAIYYYAEKNKKDKSSTKSFVSDVSDLKKNRTGISGKIDGEYYYIGNREMMLASSIAESQLETDDQIDHVVYLARERDKKVIGIIHLTDPLRDDAKEVIAELINSKKEVVICTGSDLRTAKHYAQQLGIDIKNIKANCTPIEENEGVSKVEVIESLNSEGRKIVMIGDGGNDAAPMSKCLVGMVMKSHVSDKATEDNAGIVIKGDLLMPVITGLTIAKDTMRNINVSFAMSVTYNLTSLLVSSAILLSVGFVLNPAIGVALMVVQACLILGIACYYKHKQPPILSKQRLESVSSHSALSKIFKSNSSEPDATFANTNTNIVTPTTNQNSRFSSFSQLLGMFAGDDASRQKESLAAPDCQRYIV